MKENKGEIGTGVRATDGLRRVDLRYIYSTYSVIQVHVFYIIVEQELPYSDHNPISLK